MGAYRLTTRRWIAAVFLVGTLLGGTRLWLLRRTYLERAANHAAIRGLYLRTPADSLYWEERLSHEGVRGVYPWPDKPPFVPALVAYHESMQAKWERAAAQPWWSVQPDPLTRR